MLKSELDLQGAVGGGGGEREGGREASWFLLGLAVG